MQLLSCNITLNQYRILYMYNHGIELQVTACVAMVIRVDGELHVAALMTAVDDGVWTTYLVRSVECGCLN